MKSDVNQANSSYRSTYVKKRDSFSLRRLLKATSSCRAGREYECYFMDVISHMDGITLGVWLNMKFSDQADFGNNLPPDM